MLYRRGTAINLIFILIFWMFEGNVGYSYLLNESEVDPITPAKISFAQSPEDLQDMEFDNILLAKDVNTDRLLKKGNQHTLIASNKKASHKMKYNFRSFISLLEQRNDLVRIKKEVDPKYELPSILWKFQDQKKAVLFEKVKGSSLPVIGGLLHGMERVALALGIVPTKEFIYYEDTGYIDSAVSHPLPYETVDQGPVKEVVMKGKDIDLTKFPVSTYFEHDSGPFITSAIGIARNPETGVLNMGIYRILVMGKDKMTINASPLSDLMSIYKVAEQKGEKLPIAVAIGVEPALMVAAVVKTPKTISEIDVAGALKGMSIKLVQCETNDLWVPADAEIVIEGEVDFSNKVSNQLGEFAGYYGKVVNPVINITAITRRQDAIFYNILAGPSVEHRTLGNFALVNTKMNIIRQVKQQYPHITNITLSLIGSMYHFLIAIDKQNDETPMNMIKEIFQSQVGQTKISQLIKRIVIVDDDVDVYDQDEVEWAIWSRVGTADKIMIMPDVDSWVMDYAAKAGKSVRVGIDATKDLEDVEKLRKAIIPGMNEINLEDYLE